MKYMKKAGNNQSSPQRAGEQGGKPEEYRMLLHRSFLYFMISCFSVKFFTAKQQAFVPTE